MKPFTPYRQMRQQLRLLGAIAGDKDVRLPWPLLREFLAAFTEETRLAWADGYLRGRKDQREGRNSRQASINPYGPHTRDERLIAIKNLEELKS
ncbi:hypothetical protein HMPREF9306_00206 [Propionimicrobium lymphophilum ACS-093-V-SCH5]|uniref:Uncharacterized protein n=1 Tax=Propionimicrobium lymphophilum ACS-093-V-SCH5 TaxID=883161 RepID=S2WMA6_9ACTN|nr:hypothetical protein [Propionimicrobium lymphophilum]EPD33792.1 hypothetical protein HMPREF9306_00206 [Propionimicrobium lymphophilum ACS-093-V-SCH5]